MKWHKDNLGYLYMRDGAYITDDKSYALTTTGLYKLFQVDGPNAKLLWTYMGPCDSVDQAEAMIMERLL